jgi:hypothetical protein
MRLWDISPEACWVQTYSQSCHCALSHIYTSHAGSGSRGEDSDREAPPRRGSLRLMNNFACTYISLDGLFLELTLVLVPSSLLLPLARVGTRRSSNATDGRALTTTRLAVTSACNTGK